MSKQIKYVVSVILKNKDGQFLVVKRPDDDPDLGGHWGFPAATLKDGELPEAGALRVVKDKLNCNAQAKEFYGIMYQKRNSYDLFLMDIEMQLVGDKQPNVKESSSDATVYVDQKWSNDPEDLRVSANIGSCCSSIFLTHEGRLDREDWISSLEGSELVA